MTLDTIIYLGQNMLLHRCAELPFQNSAKFSILLCSFFLWNLVSPYVQNDLNLLELYQLLEKETPPFSH